MDGPTTSRPAGGALALLVAVGALVGGLVAAAPAAAQSGTADRVTVTGVDLAEALDIQAEQQPELCAALYREVSWLVGRDGDAPEPDPATLGPQYTLVAHLEGEPRHRFHLYPLAEGGPRAFRPVEQPGDRTVTEAWFYGRIGMPETLSASGVPLTGEPPAGGGTGGGNEPAPGESEPPDPSVFGFLTEWREGMLLTGGITVAVLAGLAGWAYLIRRKV